MNNIVILKNRLKLTMTIVLKNYIANIYEIDLTFSSKANVKSLIDHFIPYNHKNKKHEEIHSYACNKADILNT
jgi:hypothetical protein